MAQRPPSRPRVAWEEDRAPQESRSPPEPYEVCMVQPLLTGTGLLPAYEEEQEIVDFIQAFVSSPEKVTVAISNTAVLASADRGSAAGLLEEEGQKIKFLRDICDLCQSNRHCILSERLDVYCHRYELAENIKLLLEEEPRDRVCSAVRRQAMLAITELSSVPTALEGKENILLHTCFTSVFLLPPEEEMRNLEYYLYSQALRAMDTMLETMVRSCSASRVSEQLQSIFQMLLNFTSSEREAVQERAMGRIKGLSLLLAKNSTLKAWHRFGQHMYGPVCYGDVQIPILGQLLGRLLLFRSSEKQICCEAATAIALLHEFMYNQKSRSMLKAKAPRLHQEDEISSLRRLTTMKDMAFAKYLQSSERADIVLVAIEAMRDSSIYEKEAAKVLHEVMRDPDFWLADVPKITSCIHKNLGCINTESARQSVESLLLLMADRYPIQVVTSLLEFSPSPDSTGMAMWEMMLSTPRTLEVVFKEQLGKLQGMKSHGPVTSATEDACTPHLALMASSEIQSEDSGDESHTESYQRHPSLWTVSLLLKSLITLSERPDSARKIQVLRPHIAEVFRNGNTDIKMKVLMVFRNVMGHLKRTEASAMALQLAEELLPLFDDESSQMRELSISLFRDVMETVVGNDKKRMKKKVRRGLIPLFLHMCDETDSVAKVSGEALITTAELLKWKELKQLLQTQQTWRTGECLLAQDRSRAEEYLSQSLPYLGDAQAALREVAVRFIGLAARALRDQSQEKLAEIYRALQPMEEDREPAVCSLARQTIHILKSPRVQQTRGRRLRALHPSEAPASAVAASPLPRPVMDSEGFQAESRRDKGATVAGLEDKQSASVTMNASQVVLWRPGGS
ncbi:maestro heat-like repeat-containing protein family member 7 [Buteo buteo]|uniref:maestro heat-like repeat-containing protein family member 7 n=1 Tax=Buteo buteo TaxID=30397 RepID=UPI003EB7CE34